MHFLKYLLSLSILTLVLPAWAALISTNAGRVSDTVITSREVVIGHWLEAAANTATGEAVKTQIQLENVRNREFARETTATLLEVAIFLEAESFGASEVAPATIESQTQGLLKKLKRISAWKALEASPVEIRKIMTRKLRAKSFIKFKMDSALIPISDQEAEEYFRSNRLKFENLPFASFKDNIKKYLAKEQSDKRLKDWFELLQSKYQVRHFLAESM
jgi:hypothetical protein